MIVNSSRDINNIQSEAGIICTLIHHPEYSFYSEQLLPHHFTDYGNMCMYTAICDLARHDVSEINAYTIIEDLNSSEATRKFANDLSVDRINEIIDLSEGNPVTQNSVEGYKLLVSNVMDAAFRRDAYEKLSECQKLCADFNVDNIEQRIYGTLDDVLTEYSTVLDIPQYKDVIDDCWQQIKERQGTGYSGIPFKFKTLNEYATIEPGELFIFAAEAKQGKSIMLLNCAVDLLQKGYSVLYLDSELSDRLFTGRMLAHLSGVEYRRVISGAYSPEEGEKIEQCRERIKTWKFTHTYIPMFDMQTIYAAVKKVRHTQGLDVLIVDYFKSSSASGDAFATYQELGNAVNLIKNQICGDMQIAGIGAAQATATGKIADSARIGRNASTIAIIQDKTPEEMQTDGPECGNKKMRIVLNRNGMQHAPGEYIDLNFRGNNILYEEARQHIPTIPF